MSLPQLDNAQIEAISGFIGDADREKGLERKEINTILSVCKIDIVAESSKEKTIYKSLTNFVNGLK